MQSSLCMPNRYALLAPPPDSDDSAENWVADEETEAASNERVEAPAPSRTNKRDRQASAPLYECDPDFERRLEELAAPHPPQGALSSDLAEGRPWKRPRSHERGRPGCQ